MNEADAFALLVDIAQQRVPNTEQINRWSDALMTINWIAQDGERLRLTSSGRRAVEQYYRLPLAGILRRAG